MARRKPNALQHELRERLAQESARLMLEHGIADFRLAKRKAAERLAVTNLGALPSNLQIEACLAERQRIFEPESHADRLAQLRQLALNMMWQLEVFEPRLTGSVLSGTATPTSRIELHVFASCAEVVSFTLERHGHRPVSCTQRYRYGGGRQIQIPGFRFRTEGAQVLVPVFPENGIREAPLSVVDRRPMPRAARHELAAMVGVTGDSVA